MLDSLSLADLTGANTLALRSRAHRLICLSRLAEVPLLADLPDARFILGGGSNVILATTVPGTVIQVALKGIHTVSMDDDAVVVQAGAGECWHDFVAHCVAQGFGGLENLALIPGTVGAAPVQNIGAYGLEVGERIIGVTAYDLRARQWREWTHDDCDFAYRDSAFKRAQAGRWLITSVRFRLPRHWQPRLDYPDLRQRPEWAQQAPTPQSVFDAVCAIRRAKLPDPRQLPNAGSFFKNPIVTDAVYRTIALAHPGVPAWPQSDGRVKLAAAWLIEHAGWKGKRLGQVGMHERHALVLVNHGGADAGDVMRLAQAVREDVAARFDVMLEPEPVMAGIHAAH